MMGTIIIVRHNTYYRTASGKSWQNNPAETYWHIMSELVFLRSFQAKDKFMAALGGTERLYKNHTWLGYVTTKDVCISPNRTEKTERLFYVFKDEKDLEQRGSAEVQAAYKQLIQDK